ncbi:hypothetical protein JB92DRAFT_2828234 [Gautieria morchelliformis]|nr:hypothetical protein JB92DRAFT_2828234 [Gautieria morchelliformis]
MSPEFSFFVGSPVAGATDHRRLYAVPGTKADVSTFIVHVLRVWTEITATRAREQWSEKVNTASRNFRVSSSITQAVAQPPAETTEAKVSILTPDEDVEDFGVLEMLDLCIGTLVDPGSVIIIWSNKSDLMEQCRTKAIMNGTGGNLNTVRRVSVSRSA